MTDEHGIGRRSAIGIGGGVLGAAVLGACGSDSESNGDGGDSGGDSGSAPKPNKGESVANTADVPVGGSVDATIGKDKVLVAQPTKGEFVAFSAVCTHQGCTVKADGDQLHCPCHDSIFDAATGEVTDGPAQEPLPSVKVKVQGNQIVTA